MKFFHSIVTQRRSRNFIARKQDESGQWLEDNDHIKESTIQFYEKLFQSDHVGRALPQLEFPLPSLLQEDNDLMMKLPTLEELKAMVFSMSKESASGPDGFGVSFYRECWEILCDDQ